MTEVLHFTGFIKGVSYRTFLTQELKEIYLDNFDVNEANTFGLIKSSNTEIAYSQWVSPKRTRSYPFARIYNTYNSSKIITIIPVLKDEGSDGDRDRIQYSTISWMNLLNIYIVLAYYDTADKSKKKGQLNKQKLGNQKFSSEFVKSQIDEILAYRQSALHWNKNLFEERFTAILQKALDCYDSISQTTGISVHSRQGMDSYLQKIIEEFEEFKNISLKGSQSASKRESLTSHKLEYLVDGLKATFCIENYLGGVYYLTPDEIFHENNIYIIQESKNTSKESLPKLSDIQDGLFKLILFSNIDSLNINGESVSFTTKLKLTGKNVIDYIIFPEASLSDMESFFMINSKVFNKNQIGIIRKLFLEAKYNKKIKIEIASNN
ncbi:hypothetical protein [Calothrix sp. 336/3]|uniref:hypothetical protein n=1 Tax=Calothrix sp. 336/3 TaxID=1337936 RepID=UPI0004E3A0FB|nr:hypothetical protein [Calothrix sp. 336/3]AKG21686.1 hypothetical protein IJ00_10830 [Calothrix sp. 336/3]